MKRFLKLIALFLLTIIVFHIAHKESTASDSIPFKFDGTVIIDSDYIDPTSLYIKIKYYDENKNFIVKSLRQDSTLVSFERYTDSTEKIPIGESKYWHENGKIKKVVNYNENRKRHGKLFTYYDNGVLKREDNYENGEFKTGKCYDSLGKEIKHFPYIVESNVNLQEIAACIKYPENLRRTNTEQKILLRVLINKFGKIVKIKYNKDNYEGFLNAAINCVIKMHFSPAIIDGEITSCWVTIPINFVLKDKSHFDKYLHK